MKKQWIVVVSTFLVATAVLGNEDSCQLPRHLFERRSALVAQSVALQKDTALSKELEAINEKYYQFVVKASSREAPKAAQAGSDCCENLGQDPVADLVCKFSMYLRTERKDTKLLLDSVPIEPRGREALWALDEIAHLHASGDSEPGLALFGPYGPVTLYIDELYHLARSGNKEALSKYLGLYPYSDGEHAEQMDDQMEKLLNSDMDLVLKQWEVFKRHRKALFKLRDSLPKDEKRALSAKVSAHQVCATRPAACDELKTLLTK